MQKGKVPAHGVLDGLLRSFWMSEPFSVGCSDFTYYKWCDADLSMECGGLAIAADSSFRMAGGCG